KPEPPGTTGSCCDLPADQRGGSPCLSPSMVFAARPSLGTFLPTSCMRPFPSKKHSDVSHTPPSGNGLLSSPVIAEQAKRQRSESLPTSWTRQSIKCCICPTPN